MAAVTIKQAFEAQQPIRCSGCGAAVTVRPADSRVFPEALQGSAAVRAHAAYFMTDCPRCGRKQWAPDETAQPSEDRP